MFFRGESDSASKFGGTVLYLRTFYPVRDTMKMALFYNENDDFDIRFGQKAYV